MFSGLKVDLPHLANNFFSIIGPNLPLVGKPRQACTSFILPYISVHPNLYSPVQSA